MTPRRVNALKLGAVMTLFFVTSCSSGAGIATTTEATVVTSTTMGPPPTTQPVTTTTELVTTTTTSVTTTLPLPDFPAAKDPLQHGGEAWAVYLVVADDLADPALDEASALAESYGYFAGVTDINCDQGAAEAVGVSSGGSEAVVGVYFESELEANQFIIAYEARGHSVAGTGLVQTFCLD